MLELGWVGRVVAETPPLRVDACGTKLIVVQIVGSSS